MESELPADWTPWRTESPLAGGRPTRADLARALSSAAGREDVLPLRSDRACAGLLRMLIVGINPSPWTAAVNAPFARPGNRFWPSLQMAGVIDRPVDASRGLSRADERMLAERGIGITNLVQRPTARADELSAAELRTGAERLLRRVGTLRPRVVCVVGITAFRTAFALPEAVLEPQRAAAIPRWPDPVRLWVVPNPSGLNAHETTRTLAEKWRAPWAASAG